MGMELTDLGGQAERITIPMIDDQQTRFRLSSQTQGKKGCDYRKK